MNATIKSFLLGGAIGMITHVLTKAPVPGRAHRRRRDRTFKAALYQHQSGRCHACRKRHPIGFMEIDHVTPIAAGGTDHDSNLQLLCRPCNRRKGKKPIHNFEVRGA